MGSKIKKLIKANKRILSNLEATETYKNEYLRTFYGLGITNISISHMKDNGVVTFSSNLSVRKDGLFHMDDVVTIQNKIEKYNKEKKRNLNGFGNVINNLRGKGLLKNN